MAARATNKSKSNHAPVGAGPRARPIPRGWRGRPQGVVPTIRRRIDAKLAKKLLKAAQQVRRKAYAPYSGYHVGAALLTSKGRIETGCNVENSSFGASVCAERIAIFKAYSDGHHQYQAIAIAAEGRKVPLPCGLCRQVLWELAGDIQVFVSHNGRIQSFRLSDLYPKPF